MKREAKQFHHKDTKAQRSTKKHKEIEGSLLLVPGLSLSASIRVICG
jgi:hypothetical protein